MGRSRVTHQPDLASRSCSFLAMRSYYCSTNSSSSAADGGIIPISIILSKSSSVNQSTCSLAVLTDAFQDGADPIPSTKPSDNGTAREMLSQISIPMFLVGLGMVGAGILLQIVTNWDVFIEIPDMIAVTTPLLGLKGDLGMTLASRLATRSNLGEMDTWKLRIKICGANLFLDQFFAVNCGLVAALFAMTMSAITSERFNAEHCLILIATSCATASVVSIVIGVLMCAIIISSRILRYNPDNVATPIAGMFGDTITLMSLALIGSFIHAQYKSNPWIPYVMLAINFSLAPVCGYLAYKHSCTRSVLKTGWISVLISVIISGGGGIFLEKFESRHPSMPLYQPVINGIGGNLVCVLASRVATQLHRDCKPGVLPSEESLFVTPWRVFFGSGEHGTAARILVLLVIPCQTAFALILHVLPDRVTINGLFLLLYVLAAFVQTATLIYIGRVLINICWRVKSDPDCNSIPYLTALGDLLGSALLVGVFEVMLLLK